MSTTCKIRMV